MKAEPDRHLSGITCAFKYIYVATFGFSRVALACFLPRMLAD